MIQHDQVSEILQRFQERDVRELSKEFTQYHNEYHPIEDLCEFSLSDPP